MKSLRALLTQEYRTLQSTERTLQKALRNLFEEESVELSDIVDVEYLYCTEDGLLQFARLSDRISKSEAKRLKSDVAKIKKSFPNAKDFPFSKIRFDKLNRLQALEARVIVSELRTAVQERNLIVSHLMKQSKRVLDDILDEYEIDRKIDADRIAEDKKRPILTSVYNNHYTEAKKIATKIENAIMRKDTLKKATKAVVDYSVSTSLKNAMKIVFTGGTRVTTEATGEALKDTDLKYYSVFVDDNKACEFCIEISKKQKKKPVPFKEMATGVNAPPYHPYCRCYIEIAD